MTRMNDKPAIQMCKGDAMHTSDGACILNIIGYEALIILDTQHWRPVFHWMCIWVKLSKLTKLDPTITLCDKYLLLFTLNIQTIIMIGPPGSGRQCLPSVYLPFCPHYLYMKRWRQQKFILFPENLDPMVTWFQYDLTEVPTIPFIM